VSGGRVQDGMVFACNFAGTLRIVMSVKARIRNKLNHAAGVTGGLQDLSQRQAFSRWNDKNVIRVQFPGQLLK